MIQQCRRTALTTLCVLLCLVSVCVCLQAPQGSPPDVWTLLPQHVLKAAAEQLRMFQDDPQAVDALLQSAVSASTHLLQRQAEQDERMAALQQQVSHLQGSLTAVLRHLQLP